MNTRPDGRDIIITVESRDDVPVSDDRGHVEGVYLDIRDADGQPVYPDAAAADLAVIPSDDAVCPEEWLGGTLAEEPEGVDWGDWVDAMQATFRADAIRVRRPAPATGAVETFDRHVVMCCEAGRESARTITLRIDCPHDIRDILAAGGPHYDGDGDALAYALADHGLPVSDAAADYATAVARWVLDRRSAT